MSDPNINQDIQTQNVSKRQITRKKRKLRKKSHRKVNQAKATYKKWTYEINTNKRLNRKTKNNLFQVHRLSQKIEKNNLKLFKLNSSLNSETEKPENSTTTTNANQGNTTEVILEIKTLSKANQVLENAINKIKLTTLSHQTKLIINTRQSVPRNIIRLKHLTQTYHSIVKLFKTRAKLIKLNTANLLSQFRTSEINNKLAHISHIFKEHNSHPETNKIHNFTDIKLNDDFINLLNKGTNFIPTALKFNVNNFNTTIFNEVKHALDKVIHSTNSTHTHINKIKHYKKHTQICKNKPYPTKNPIQQLNLK